MYYVHEVGLSLPQVVKKVPKKVILLKSTEESTQKCTKKVLKLKSTQKRILCPIAPIITVVVLMIVY